MEETKFQRDFQPAHPYVHTPAEREDANNKRGDVPACCRVGSMCVSLLCVGAAQLLNTPRNLDRFKIQVCSSLFD